MDEYMFLVCVLVGAMVFLAMCFGAALMMTTVDMIRNNDREEMEDDAFSEIGIAEGD